MVAIPFPNPLSNTAYTNRGRSNRNPIWKPNSDANWVWRDFTAESVMMMVVVVVVGGGRGGERNKR